MAGDQLRRDSTKHMPKDGQVCFHRRLFADPVKSQRCTTELHYRDVRPLDGINKDVGGAKLLLTTTSVYLVDCACICSVLKTLTALLSVS